MPGESNDIGAAGIEDPAPDRTPEIDASGHEDALDIGAPIEGASLGIAGAGIGAGALGITAAKGVGGGLGVAASGAGLGTLLGSPVLTGPCGAGPTAVRSAPVYGGGTMSVPRSYGISICDVRA